MHKQWVRLWLDLPNDPKWRTIARLSGASIGDVIAVYIHMLAMAANATERSRTQGWCDEDVATALDTTQEKITAIRAAMQGRVLDGDRLTGWDKRQPLREDGASERAKAFRERNRTQPNATERQRRGEKKRVKSPSRDKREPDPRHVEFKEILSTAWKAKNPGEMPWDGGDAKKLASLLAASPNLSSASFLALLRHRHKSEVNHAERPRAWLDRVTDYANGPIDRYGKPMETPPEQVKPLTLAEKLARTA